MIPFVAADQQEYALVAAIAAGIATAVLLGRGGGWQRLLVAALAGAHLGLVAAVTLLPLPQQLAPSFGALGNVSLVPGATIELLRDGPQAWRQLGGNVLLLAPAGLLLPQVRSDLRPFGRTLAAGLALAVGIELLQLLVGLVTGVAYRVVDVDDVLLNVLGVTLGRGVLALWHAATR